MPDTSKAEQINARATSALRLAESKPHQIQSTSSGTNLNLLKDSDLEVIQIADFDILDLFMTLLTKILSRNSSTKQIGIEKCLKKIRAFFKRFLYLAGQSSELVLAMIYLDKLHSMNSSFLLTVQNAFELIATAVGVAAKYLDDKMKKGTLKELTGIDQARLNFNEIKFVSMIDYQLYVAPSTYQAYIQKLTGYKAKKSSQQSQLLKASQADTI